jgi:hypothetical protein
MQSLPCLYGAGDKALDFGLGGHGFDEPCRESYVTKTFKKIGENRGKLRKSENNKRI